MSIHLRLLYIPISCKIPHSLLPKMFMLHSYIPLISQMAILNRLTLIKILYVFTVSPNPTTYQTYHGWLDFTILTLLVTGIKNKAPNYAKLVILSFSGPNTLFSTSFSQTLS